MSITTVRKTATLLLKETVREWMEDGASGIAASLAYYTIFSLSPLLIIIALFLGLILDEATIETSFTDALRGTVGDSGAEIVRSLVAAPRSGDGSDTLGSIVWLAVVVWGASGLFAQLQNALNKIWEVKAAPGRSPFVFFKNKLFSFTIVILVGLVLLTIMFTNSVISNMLGDANNLALSIPIRIGQFIVTMLMSTVLIAAVFKILPDVIIRWRDLWVGSAFTAFLFFVGQLIVGLYLSRSNVGSVFGAASSLTAILVWIYYSAQILLFGAEFTEVWARHYGSAIRPDHDATWTNEAHARREAMRANVDFEETDTEVFKEALMAEYRARRNERVKKVFTTVKDKLDGDDDDDAKPVNNANPVNNPNPVNHNNDVSSDGQSG